MLLFVWNLFLYPVSDMESVVIHGQYCKSNVCGFLRVTCLSC